MEKLRNSTQFFFFLTNEDENCAILAKSNKFQELLIKLVLVKKVCQHMPGHTAQIPRLLRSDRKLERRTMHIWRQRVCEIILMISKLLATGYFSDKS